jgi:hypothetical protein
VSAVVTVIIAWIPAIVAFIVARKAEKAAEHANANVVLVAHRLPIIERRRNSEHH